MDDQPLTVMYASYDSVPKHKRPTQQQIKLGAEVMKIDSIIRNAQMQLHVHN